MCVPKTLKFDHSGDEVRPSGLGGHPNTRMSGDAQTFDELYASLAAIQNPWRNATMHLDQKYTEQEAKDISDVVRAFMSRVAKRCDENGLPPA